MTPAGVADPAQATILVAEGDDVLRREIARALVQRGFDVVDAADAQSAMKVLRDTATCVDWLITDVDLGDMSGIHVAFEYRFRQPTRPIMVISEFEMPAEIDRIAGAVVIRKPFGMSYLVSELDTLLMQDQGAADRPHAPTRAV